MPQKKKSNISKAILNLVLMVPNLFSFVKNIISLAGLEARLAGRSIILIIVLSLLSVCVLTSTWLCMLGFVFLYLYSLKMSLLFCMFVIFMMNILLLLIISMLLCKYKNNLSFPATRRQIRKKIRNS